MIREARPNPAHDALAELVRGGRIDLLVTADSPALLRQAEASVRSRGVLVEPRFLMHQSTDLAAARLAYSRARAQGIGKEVSL